MEVGLGQSCAVPARTVGELEVVSWGVVVKYGGNGGGRKREEGRQALNEGMSLWLPGDCTAGLQFAWLAPPLLPCSALPLRAGEKGGCAIHCPFLPLRGASPSAGTSLMLRLHAEGAEKGMHRKRGWCEKLCSSGIFLLKEYFWRC